MPTNAQSEAVHLPGFLEARRQVLPFDLAFGKRQGSLSDWRKALLDVWRASLPPSLGVRRAHRDGVQVRLTFSNGAEAEGWLIIPSGRGPHPAVLLFHEHGGAFDTGWEKLFDVAASSGTRARHYGGRAVADDLLRAGFAVLCLDMIGFGRRQARGYGGQQALAAAALGMGWGLAGITAAEDIEAARWLASQPEISPQRIASFGFSMGGFRAWQAAALSPDIQAAVSMSWMACRADLMRPGAPLLKGHSAFHVLHPGLAHRADFPDLAGLAAGKPLFFRSGRGDRHMPEASVSAAWTQIRGICGAGEGPLPDTGFHDAGHSCPVPVLEDAVSFLGKSLM